MSFKNIEKIREPMKFFKKNVIKFIKSCQKIRKELTNDVNKFKKSYSDDSMLRFTDITYAFKTISNLALGRVSPKRPTEEGTPPTPTQTS